MRISVGDETEVIRQSIQLAVLPAQSVATAGSWWKPRWQAVAWRAWLEQGFGFLVLWLVHLLGMNLLASLERQSLEEAIVTDGLENGQIAVHRRFFSYRILIRLASLSATIALAAWLVCVSRSFDLSPLTSNEISRTGLAGNVSCPFRACPPSHGTRRSPTTPPGAFRSDFRIFFEVIWPSFRASAADSIIW